MIAQQKDLIVSPNGDILLTIRDDQTQVAKTTQNMKANGGGWDKDRNHKVSMRIPTQEYYYWLDRMKKAYNTEENCWDDPAFQKFYKAKNPHFCL